MKKLVAAVLTGVLVAGTLSTGVYAKDDDKTITVAASATPHAEILEEAKPLLVARTLISNGMPVTKAAQFSFCSLASLTFSLCFVC